MNDSLQRFLTNPRIVVEVVESKEVEELRERATLAEAEAHKAMLLYARECDLNNRLIDILKLHGIEWR